MEWTDTFERESREFTRMVNKAGGSGVGSRKSCRFWLQSLNGGAVPPKGGDACLGLTSTQVLTESIGSFPSVWDGVLAREALGKTNSCHGKKTESNSQSG